MLSKFWDSLDDVSKAVSWTQLALILFGGITLSLTYVQYKLSIRKDFLSGSSQKQKEEILNNRVSDASRDAKNSIVELSQAKRDLAETQEQFAKAANDAHSAVLQLSAAQETIDQLRARSGKIETLGIRIQIVFGTPQNVNKVNSTYIDSAPIVALATPDRKVLTFGSQQSRGLTVSETVRVHGAELQILDQSSIAGKDIKSLGDYRVLAIGISPYLDRISLRASTSTVSRVEAYLRINGTEIQIFNGSVERSMDSLSNGELQLDVTESMGAIAEKYNKLMTN
ncbi:hypothetical protein [Granulicella sp. S190]|uniref:hypothetical protein n=1 Tax=Granulicella sp. S190 TaxID=1747226 RepID=UPI00131E6E41|nr:hypothetical protein [Granulicella sp. S190]